MKKIAYLYTLFAVTCIQGMQDGFCKKLFNLPLFAQVTSTCTHPTTLASSAVLFGLAGGYCIYQSSVQKSFAQKANKRNDPQEAAKLVKIEKNIHEAEEPRRKFSEAKLEKGLEKEKKTPEVTNQNKSTFSEEKLHTNLDYIGEIQTENLPQYEKLSYHYKWCAFGCFGAAGVLAGIYYTKQQ